MIASLVYWVNIIRYQLLQSTILSVRLKIRSLRK
nr:MAG TPA: hypothetical protein [Caudoviricetes sp.]